MLARMSLPRPALALPLFVVGIPMLAVAVTRPYTPTIDVQAANVFLQSPKSILSTSSASGAHLYVTGGSGVVALGRDVATGTVRFVERVDVDPSSQSTGEGALSPDGLHLYVPTQAPGTFSGFELSIFARDDATGTLTPAGGVAVPGGVNAVAVSPDGAHVYATGLGLSVFARDAGTGALTFVETQPVANATGVDLSSDGASVYVTRPLDDSITIWARDAGTGALAPRGTITDGVGGADGLDGVTDLVVSPDGLHVYAAGEAEDAVAVFLRSPSTGFLTLVEVQREGLGGVGGLVRPSAVFASADGMHVYAASPPNVGLGAPGGIIGFTRDAGTGALTFLGTIENGGIVEAIGGPALGASPDGLFLYAASGPSLAVVGREPLSGATTFVQRRSGFGGFALQGARDLAASSDGQHVYVASEIDRAIGIFSSSAGGALVFSDAVYQGEQPDVSAVRALGLSPDGATLYAASGDTATLAWFGRDPLTGALVWLGASIDGVDGVSGLTDPVQIAVSPDGAHVYVLGGATGSIAAFARDPGTGTLTFVSSLGGLGDVRAFALSGDGTSLYVVASASVSAFARDAGTGALTFVATVSDGEAGAEHLAGARDVVVTPDGTQVLVAAEDDDAITVFARDGGSGVLTPIVTMRDQSGVGSIDAPRSVLVHPDGATVLVVANTPLPGSSTSGAALWTFDRAGDGTLAFVNVAALADVMRTARFGPGQDAYAIQIGFGLRLYRFFPGFAGCDPLPRTGCKTRGSAGRAKLALKVRTPTKPVLKWKWSNGAPTFAADLEGMQAAGAAWCLYDESGPTPVLMARALAPGDSVRWRTASATKIKYKDKGRAPEGVLGILVSTSASSGRAKIKVKGNGTNLTVPVPALPLPIRTQLQGPSGCWEATFSSGGARLNGLGQFIGNAD